MNVRCLNGTDTHQTFCDQIRSGHLWSILTFNMWNITIEIEVDQLKRITIFHDRKKNSDELLGCIRVQAWHVIFVTYGIMNWICIIYVNVESRSRYLFHLIFLTTNSWLHLRGLILKCQFVKYQVLHTFVIVNWCHSNLSIDDRAVKTLCAWNVLVKT